MSRAIAVTDFGIVFGALIYVFDHQTDRGACCDLTAEFLFDEIIGENAGQDTHLIRLTSLGHKPGCAGATQIQILLNILSIEPQAGRAAIHDAANCRTMAFTPGGDTKEMSERIV